jgi:hypothetical protein
MLKQSFSKITKVLTVLLTVFFVASITVGAASACGSSTSGNHCSDGSCNHISENFGNHCSDGSCNHVYHHGAKKSCHKKSCHHGSKRSCKSCNSDCW